MSSIEYSNTNQRLGALIADFSNGDIVVPPHQRDYVWTLKQQKRLVDAVSQGMPFPNITLRVKRAGGLTIVSLEDGQQRLKTLQRFMTNAFQNSAGLTFSQLSDVNRAKFESYTVNILSYKKATDEEAIVIFNNLQNGSSCSVGERIYSLAKISPIVQFTVDYLLTPGVGFYDRTVPFWGERSAKGQRGSHTTTALALCAGLAFGSQFISKKWNDIEDIVSREFDRHRVVADLETIVSLFETLHAEHPIVSKHLKKTYWDLGTFTGYIVHALKLTTEIEPGLPIPSRETMMERFKTLMIEHRLHPERITETLHRDLYVIGRGWFTRRWHLGWRRLFAPTSFVGPVEADELESDDDSEY
jgi:hypothetical protein